VNRILAGLDPDIEDEQAAPVPTRWELKADAMARTAAVDKMFAAARLPDPH
jgi:hypothetical protein